MPASPQLLAALAGPAPVWTVSEVEGLPAGGLIVTARSTDRREVVSRSFAPAYGIPEDPVTGSAHCTIGP